MKVTINDKELELRMTNTLGPAYEFQRMTGRPTETDQRMVTEMVYGALVLWNRGEFMMTFEEFLQNISDNELVKAIQFVSERIVALNRDAEPTEAKEEGQGES